MKIEYQWLQSNFAMSNDALVEECSQLYSTQYGKWSIYAPQRCGKNIKISRSKMKEWLSNEHSAIYWAQDGEKIIGYAIAVQLNVPKYGVISWVTQLVVHEDYRHQDVAKNILHSIWGFTDNYAWGIVSANPYAIRALEKTTRRRCEPARIKQNSKKIQAIGIENLSYIDEKTEFLITKEISRINTNFYVDHSNVNQMVDNVVTDAIPWTLGPLEEGWEWIAFTFRDQIPFELTEQEIDSMLSTSESVVQNAYRRMDITEKHRWIANTDSEVEFIMRECDLNQGDSLIDFGCGQGRHSLALAKKGISVLGVDYIDRNIEIAEKQKKEFQLNTVEFLAKDCRYITTQNKVKAVICLYDVIGTYEKKEDNLQILHRIYDSLITGGIALISVMNYELTETQAKYKFVLRDNPSALLRLKPSAIMEETGNIFDPEHYLIDTDTRVVYRREQFTKGRSLPVELIVRDKRFTGDEIVSMCEKVGFSIIFSRYVNAKDWETKLPPTHKRAKEILIKCQKQ